MEKWKASLYRAALALQPRPAWLRAGAQLFSAQGNIPARQAEGIRRALQAHCAVGAAVALFDDAAVTGTLAYGAARFENGRPVPVTPDTVFRAASVSKHVTALAVMRLAQAGQIDLDADVDEYLLDETGKLCLDKAKLIVYSHGEYLALGKKLGTFGYTVRKKKPARKKK